MRLPFGLDLKTMVVTALIIYFVLPFVLSWFGKMRSGGNENA